MNIPRYLQRIQVEDQAIHDFQFLSTLQRQHLFHIYFENIDISAGKSLSLDWKQQYKKIVQNHRGGVCFELNGLFHQLLKQLGYQVHMVAATTRTPQGWSPIEGSHLINLVQFDDGFYLVDVGFGGKAPRMPVALNGEITDDLDGAYRVCQVMEDHAAMFILERKEENQWEILYRFQNVARRIEDFAEKCRIVETSPHSPFSRGYFLSRVTERGRITLTDDSLTIVMDGVKKKRKIAKEEIKSLIQTHFQISI